MVPYGHAPRQNLAPKSSHNTEWESQEGVGGNGGVDRTQLNQFDVTQGRPTRRRVL